MEKKCLDGKMTLFDGLVINFRIVTHSVFCTSAHGLEEFILMIANLKLRALEKVEANISKWSCPFSEKFQLENGG